MKKILFAFICGLGLLTAMPAYAQDKEIAAATVQLEAYLKANMRGDISAAMDYMTTKYRAQTEEVLQAAPEMREFAVELLKLSIYNIVDIQKQNGVVLARVAGFMPNMEQIMAKATESLPEEIEVQNMDEVFKAIFVKSCEILQNEDYETTPFEHNITMLKENGLWKVDAEE